MSPAARRLNAFFQLAFAFVLFLSVNALGNVWLSPYRLDLTEDKLFTVSAGGRAILEGLDAPVTLTLYFSETAAVGNPPLLRFGRRVADFLRAVERASAGAVTLKIVDVAPFSPEEDEAARYGLQPVVGEGGQARFLGLAATDETDRLETIPRFAEERDRFLEYDVMKTIYLLARDGKPRLGLLSGLPMRFGLGGALAFLQGQGQPYVLYSQLAQFFEVVNLDPGFAEIPKELDALLVVHPPALGEAQYYAIEQAVLSGLPTLVFVDPYAEASELAPAGGYPGAQGIPASSTLGPLLEAWGIAYDPARVVVDRALAQKAEVGGGPTPRVVDFPNWIGVRTAGLNPDNPATADLGILTFASAGAIGFSGGPELTFTPLVTTSAEAARVSVGQVTGDFDPRRLLDEIEPSEQFTLIAAVSGIARSVFSAPPEGTNDVPFEAEGKISVVVGGDSDLFDDRFWARVRRDALGRDVLVPIADNAALIVNLIDQMAGQGDLARLQARGVSSHPLEVFEKMKRDASDASAREETRLKDRLAEAEQRLLTRQAESADGSLGPAGEEEVRKLRDEVLQIRTNLRDVERRLREDVSALEARIILLNSALVPGLLLLIAGGLWLVRRRKGRP
jgi:gliding motility-associatede transport system auxiliary component